MGDQAAARAAGGRDIGLHSHMLHVASPFQKYVICQYTKKSICARVIYTSLLYLKDAQPPTASPPTFWMAVVGIFMTKVCRYVDYLWVQKYMTHPSGSLSRPIQGVGGRSKERYTRRRWGMMTTHPAPCIRLSERILYHSGQDQAQQDGGIVYIDHRQMNILASSPF
jgi:hypothetical protein